MKYDICVVGGCSIDRIFFVNDKGNYEKNPDIINFGGKGANQAIAASRAGSNVIIISRLGKGAKGELILNNLINNKVVTSSIDMIENLENDMANIFVDDKSKDNKIDRIIEATDSFTIDLIKNSKELILNSKYVVTSTKLPKEVYEYLINYCYENSIPTVITPSIPAKISIKENKKLIDKISIITCNEKECQIMFDTFDIGTCVSNYPKKLIVTLGKRGVIYNNGEKNIIIPSPNIDKVEDTTGAGDTFNGNLVSALIQGNSLYDSIVKAQFAASMKIKVKSAQNSMPYKEELEKYIEEYKKSA